jgi:hypothetical protein
LKGVALIIGIAIMVFAVGIAVIPQFTSCGSQGKAIQISADKTVPMKCTWTGQGELALSLPVFAVGAMMAASRRKESIRNLSILGIILGVAVLLTSTMFIGVCATPGMLCNSVMLPSLILLGSLVILGSLIGLIASIKGKEAN